MLRAAAAEEKAAHRGPVLRPSSDGAHNEHLVQAHLTVEDVAAGDAEAALQIERRQHLAALDNCTDIGHVLLD